MSTVTTAYSYDKGHNRTSKTVNGVATAYVLGNGYNGAGANQIISETTSGVAAGYAYAYDGNGNRIARTAVAAVAMSGNTTDGSSVITGLASTAGFVAGMSVSGPGLPPDATVDTIISSSVVSLVGYASATGTGVALTFAYPALATITHNGNTTSGSTIITGISTATLRAGMAVSGLGIPWGATVATIVSSSSISLSAAASATNISVALTFTFPPTFTRNGNTTSGSTTISGLSTTTGLAAGMGVSGLGIPTGATVATIASSTSLTLSAAATASHTRTPLTFTSQSDAYSYDDENRLIGLIDETGSSPGTYAYAYDYRTRRVTRTEPGPVTTNVVFDGGTSIEEFTSSAGSPTVEYVRGHDYGGGVGGLEYSVRSGTPSFNFYDSRGDVTTKTDGSGTVTYQTGYEAFGNQTASTGTTPLDRQRASTKEQDPTGLLNEGFRYRDPSTGTFLTRDPLGFKAGPNMYTYVRQNPWTHFDPEGLDSSQPNPPPPPPPPPPAKTSSNTPPAKQTTSPNQSAPSLTFNPQAKDQQTASAAKAFGFSSLVASGSPTASAAATGLGGFGAAMADTGNKRGEYASNVAKETSSEARTALTQKYLAEQNTLGKSITTSYNRSRGGGGAEAGGGTVNKSNPAIDALGKGFRIVGKGMVVADLAYDTYRVGTSKNPGKELFQIGFGIFGGLGGGISGAFVGSAVPVAGTIALGAAGSVAGGLSGERVGGEIYDRFFSP